MHQQPTKPAQHRTPLALVGILFVVPYFVSDFLRNNLSSMALPLPNAPVEEAMRYLDGSRAAVLAVGVCQVISAIALFIFAGSVVSIVSRSADDGSALPDLSRTGGLLAATLYLVCAILGMVLVPIAASGNLGLVSALRTANFLTGGTLHVASLGIFIGAASLIARRAKLLPRWICWLGIILAVVSLLSLASLFVYFANAFILLGRLLAFVWTIAAGIALALGKRQRPATAERVIRHVLA